MALDLETLRTEVQAYLEKSGLPVFYGNHRLPESLNQVAWDVETHPDFREFLATGQKAGVKIIVFNHSAFSLDQIDEALDQVETSDLSREEKRNFEARLRQFRAYEGFTCSLELSFSIENQIYVYELYTEWFETMTGILAELDALTQEDDGEENTLGGYFSNN